MDLHLTLDPARPVTRQLFEQVRDAVLSGRLLPGDALPSTRSLATSLGVSRTTVLVAVDHLMAEGYLRARAGVGTYVSPDVHRVEQQWTPPSTLRPIPLWTDESWGVPEEPGASEFEFGTGIPDTSHFPFATWRRLLDSATQAATEHGRYADPQGVPALRRSIARHLAVSRGLQVSPDDVVVTAGVQQAITLLAQILLEPGDVVAVEDPGYLLVRRALTAARARVVPVPVDAEGLAVHLLPAGARLVYVTPAHQFPLGVRMSSARRSALLEWARDNDAAVVEDDYDTDFRYGGRPIDALHSLDRAGRVVYMGSFSKVLLPSLRLGYCVAPPGLREALRRARFVADWHGPVAPQLALAGFIDEGRLTGYIRRMRRQYQAKRDRLIGILDSDFDDVLARIPSAAGLHLAAWTRSDDADVGGWLRRAKEHGTAVTAVRDYAFQSHRPGLVFGFGAISEARIEPGLARLRAAIDA